MIENIWFIAAFWMGLALLASLVSIRLGISIIDQQQYSVLVTVVIFERVRADAGRAEVLHLDHSELWGRLLGDTADRIRDHAHCSVLIVKPGEK